MKRSELERLKKQDLVDLVEDLTLEVVLNGDKSSLSKSIEALRAEKGSFGEEILPSTRRRRNLVARLITDQLQRR